MDSSDPEGAELPPPPAIIPPNVVPTVAEETSVEVKKTSTSKRVPMSRPGLGSKGKVTGNAIGRKVVDKVKETYDRDLGRKEFGYDGQKNLFSVGTLPRKRLDFVVVLDNVSPSRRVGSAGGSSSYDQLKAEAIGSEAFVSIQNNKGADK